MYKKRIVVFGTRGQELTSRHLEKLVECGANIVALVEAPPGSIISVHKVKNPYEDINDVAARLNIPLFSPKDPNDPEFINTIKKYNPNVIIVLCYQFFLKKRLLAVPVMGAINFHNSPLPRHAGRHPGFWTIWYGDKESGMVVHFLDAGIDTGDIIYQTKVPVLPGDTIDKVYKRVFDTSEKLIGRLLDDIENESIPRKSQDFSKYLYNYEITEKDYELDFRQSAEVLFGRVKMAPGKFYFLMEGQKYGIQDCSIMEEPVKNRNFETGVPYVMNKKLVFVTPRKYLQVNEIIKDGKSIDPLLLVK